nr:initiation control protein YabA [Lacticaseibacillus pantheris]
MADRDVFEEFQQAADTASALAQKLENLREDFTAVLEQNAELKIENEHLRDRLQELIDQMAPPRASRLRADCQNRRLTWKKFTTRVITFAHSSTAHVELTGNRARFAPQ